MQNTGYVKNKKLVIGVDFSKFWWYNKKREFTRNENVSDNISSLMMLQRRSLLYHFGVSPSGKALDSDSSIS